MRFLFASLFAVAFAVARNRDTGAATTTRRPSTYGPFEGFPEGVTGYRIVNDDEEPRADDFMVRGLRYRRT